MARPETAPEEPTAITAVRRDPNLIRVRWPDAPDAQRAPAATDPARRPRAPAAPRTAAADAAVGVPTSPSRPPARGGARGRRFARLAHGSAMALCWLALAPSARPAARHGKSLSRWRLDAHRRAGMAVAGGTLAPRGSIAAERGGGRRRGDATEKSARSRARWCWARAAGDTTATVPEGCGRRWAHASAASSRASGRITARGCRHARMDGAWGWGWYAATCAIVAEDRPRRRRNRGDGRACTDSNWGEPREEASGGAARIVTDRRCHSSCGVSRPR